MAGANGNSKIQFIVIRQEGSGNLWGPQGVETQSRVMLLFFDATGRETGKFKFPKNAPGPTAADVLIATQEFASLTGATPDFIIPPLLNPISGKVCFTNNPLNSPFPPFPRTDCVSYGSFPAAQTGTNSGGCNGVVGAGLPAAALPIVNMVSLKRTSTSCGSVPNSDFVINMVPTPSQTFPMPKTFTIPSATQITQGQNLFNNETFQGNGRTCASCHIASLNLALPPSNIQSRFATLSTTFDPLFVAETKPSSFPPDPGFDFNLNTLVLTQAVANPLPCSGTLKGIITSAGGAKAKVLTQISPTTYLVYGGMNPQLSGTVSDSNSCSGTVSSITLTAAPLGANSIPDVLGLEDPLRMRKSADAVSFPQGRGLILENIDGFPPTPPVFRKAPHLLNLKQRTGPFGLSGCCVDLQSFATGAVIQHFPRTLARNSSGSDPDFRLPTSDELAAMKAFMLAQEFPAGTDPDKFNLNRFAITAAQQRGRDAFFGAAKCSQCHGGPVLAQTTVSILGKPIGITATFNTGVVNQSINLAAGDNLPCEPSVGDCGSREFSVRQLFNVANLGPFFHDASSATLGDAVLFYNSSLFNTSPAGMAIGGINTTAIGPTTADDITAFLEGLSFSPFRPTFGPVGTVVTITGTNFTGATAVTFNRTAATSFTVVSDTSITATVPTGATTGPITVTPPSSGPLMTTTRFTVTPAITSFTPASGPVGTVVTITGTTFTGATAAKFNGVAATSFTVVSDTSITATVPTGATTGPITVTTPDGTATSATSFTVSPTDFLLSGSPASRTITAGQMTTYTVSVSPTGGFTGSAMLSCSGAPAAATCSVSPASVTLSGPSAATATVTVTTDTTTPTGSFTVTITGVSGSLTHTTSVTLVVTDFSLSATPSSQTVSAGASTSYTVNITPTGGFAGAVTFSAAGLPAGATASFSPNPASGNSSTVTVTTATTTPTGSFVVAITGVSGSLTHTTSVTLVVIAPDFSLSATPSSQTVSAGASTTYTVNITRPGGFTGDVTFSAARLPAGAAPSFSPNPASGNSSTMTVTTATTTPTGSFPVTITGVSGTLTRTTSATLVVTAAADFSLSATPSSQTVSAGASTSYTVNITPTGGFAGAVTFSAAGLPAGATPSFSPNPASGNSSTVTVTTATTTPTSSFTVTITGVSGSLTHSTSLTLVVTPAGAADFSLSATPSSQTVFAGASTSYTVNITRTGDFAGAVTFSAAGLPAGATPTFSPNPASGNSSTVTVTTTARALLAPWPKLRLPPATFSARGWPLWAVCLLVLVLLAHRTKTRRQAAGWVFTATVFVALLGVACGGGGGSAPPPPGGTPPGTYTLTITGTSGSLSRTTTVTLVVN